MVVLTRWHHTAAADFVGSTIMITISSWTTSQMGSVGFRSGDCGGRWSTANTLLMSRKPFWRAEFCELSFMWLYVGIMRCHTGGRIVTYVVTGLGLCVVVMLVSIGFPKSPQKHWSYITPEMAANSLGTVWLQPPEYHSRTKYSSVKAKLWWWHVTFRLPQWCKRAHWLPKECLTTVVMSEMFLLI